MKGATVLEPVGKQRDKSSLPLCNDRYFPYKHEVHDKRGHRTGNLITDLLSGGAKHPHKFHSAKSTYNSTRTQHTTTIGAMCHVADPFEDSFTNESDSNTRLRVMSEVPEADPLIVWQVVKDKDIGKGEPEVVCKTIECREQSCTRLSASINQRANASMRWAVNEDQHAPSSKVPTHPARRASIGMAQVFEQEVDFHQQDADDTSIRSAGTGSSSKWDKDGYEISESEDADHQLLGDSRHSISIFEVFASESDFTTASRRSSLASRRSSFASRRSSLATLSMASISDLSAFIEQEIQAFSARWEDRSTPQIGPVKPERRTSQTTISFARWNTSQTPTSSSPPMRPCRRASSSRFFTETQKEDIERDLLSPKPGYFRSISVSAIVGSLPDTAKRSFRYLFQDHSLESCKNLLRETEATAEDHADGFQGSAQVGSAAEDQQEVKPIVARLLEAAKSLSSRNASSSRSRMNLSNSSMGATLEEDEEEEGKTTESSASSGSVEETVECLDDKKEPDGDPLKPEDASLTGSDGWWGHSLPQPKQTWGVTA